ncbi:MAG: phage tail assembly protein [Beijerinckiaceae bacterium]|nr:phage tail assembly protein [Beijerinckiaceae bacterium]
MDTITLARPIVHDGKDYKEFPVDEPTMGAIEAMEDARRDGKSDATAFVMLLAHDSGWPADAIRKVRASDFKRITEAFAPFVAAETESGGSPST